MPKIYFKDSNGRKICGNLKHNDSDSAVLICHGLGGHKENQLYKTLQEKIHSLGHGVLTIDFLGHGESDGEYNDLTLSEAIDDIKCAKKFLHDKGYKNISFIGYSFGGVGGVMAHDHFRFMVLISPPTYYDITEMVKSGIYLLRELRYHNKNHKERKKAHVKVKFFRDYGSHDSYAAAEKINSRVLIIQGDADKIVPLAKSKELKKHIKGSRIKIFKGADHKYSDPTVKEKLIEEVMKFVEENY